MMKRRTIAAVATVGMAALIGGCSTDADVASRNLSKEAEQFQIQRRIVFFNGITDKYLLEIQGRCSVETTEGGLDGALEVTCKIGDDEFKKHYLGLSDNVSYFVEQMESKNVSTDHYKVIFKPEVIIPDVDLQ